MSRGDLLDLLKASGALRFGEFTLASGKTSPYYVDIKKAVTKPEILRAIGRGIAKYAHRADRIAGVELGAVPIAAVVDREEGGKEALASIDVILRALVTSEELMQAAKSGTPSRSLP